MDFHPTVQALADDFNNRLLVLGKTTDTSTFTQTLEDTFRDAGVEYTEDDGLLVTFCTGMTHDNELTIIDP
jgi:hypothetical protein